MKKSLLFNRGSFVMLCVELIILVFGAGPQVHAQSSDVYLSINRNSTTISAQPGEKGVEAARITLTNTSDKPININMPRFSAMADTDFDLRNNIDAAHFADIYDSEGHTATDDLSGAKMNEAKGLTFNVGMAVPEHSTATWILKVDISSHPRVQALAFDLDFTSKDFTIYDLTNMSAPVLVPFNLSGTNSIVCIHGSAGYCPMINVYTSDTYSAFVAFINQSGPLYAPYIPEGGMIRDQFGVDVYIVKYANGKRFKRLILSPSVFNSYGHLKWSDIKDVSSQVLNSYATSDYVFVAGDSTIWKLEPQGDTGIKRRFLAPNLNPIPSWNFDPNGIYEINTTDRDSYILGPDITS
jgi:hypothetical protein